MEHIKMIPNNLCSPQISHTCNNYLACNEHTNTYFKCNKSLKLSDQYNLHVSDDIFQLLPFTIDEEKGRICLLLVNSQIYSHPCIIQGPTINYMNILRVNRSKTKYCVLHNGMIT